MGCKPYKMTVSQPSVQKRFHTQIQIIQPSQHGDPNLVKTINLKDSPENLFINQNVKACFKFPSKTDFGSIMTQDQSKDSVRKVPQYVTKSVS